MSTLKWILFLNLFSFPVWAFDPSARFKALIVHSAGTDFLSNPFIEKCFQSKELPLVTAPKIQVATDTEMGKNLYFVHFNGADLRPKLVLGDGKKVDLEKSSDSLGYVFSLMKPITESEFTLQFEIQNPQKEYVLYNLHIGKTEAQFIELLSEAQAQRVCIRNQVWFGFGMSAFSFDQKVEGIEAKSKFTSLTAGSLHLDLRYYPNSQWGILGSYKSAPGKIKTTESTLIDSNQFRWNIYEVAFQWRNQNWMNRWKQVLVYPYLRGSYQGHQMPRIFIDEVGDSTLDSIQLHQATVGVGANIFDRKSRFFEAYLNLKHPFSSQGQTTRSGIHLDGGIGVGTVIQKRINVGLFWYGHYDQYQYSVLKNGTENTGQTTLIFSNLDLKLGLSF